MKSEYMFKNFVLMILVNLVGNVVWAGPHGGSGTVPAVPPRAESTIPAVRPPVARPPVRDIAIPPAPTVLDGHEERALIQYLTTHAAFVDPATFTVRRFNCNPAATGIIVEQMNNNARMIQNSFNSTVLALNDFNRKLLQDSHREWSLFGEAMSDMTRLEILIYKTITMIAHNGFNRTFTNGIAEGGRPTPGAILTRQIDFTRFFADELSVSIRDLTALAPLLVTRGQDIKQRKIGRPIPAAKNITDVQAKCLKANAIHEMKLLKVLADIIKIKKFKVFVYAVNHFPDVREAVTDHHQRLEINVRNNTPVFGEKKVGAFFFPQKGFNEEYVNLNAFLMTIPLLRASDWGVRPPAVVRPSSP